jgi:hypothetical protein
MNSEVLKECKSEDCKLNNKALTVLKRIKSHCISCVPEQNLKGVRECTGELLNGICPLHLYREGHNPKRKGIGNTNAKGNPEVLKRYRETRTKTAFFSQI